MNRSCRLSLGVLLCAVAAIAQQQQPVTSKQPDCIRFFTLAAVGTTTPIDVHPAGCDLWVLTYSVNGFSAMSLVVESSLDGAGGTTPAAWVTFAGTVLAGVNPNTDVTGTQVTTQLKGYYPWVRMNLASKTGGGSVIGILQGWKLDPNGSQSGGIVFTGCTVTTPCVVVGPAANGAAAATAPVLTAGYDGANVRTILTNNTGNEIPASAATAQIDGQTNTPNVPVGNTASGQIFNVTYGMCFNGTSWDRCRGAAATDNTSQIANIGVQRVQMAIANAAGFTRNVISLNQLGDGGGGDNVFAAGNVLFNGTNWDRWRGTALGGAFVQGPGVVGSASVGFPVRIGLRDLAGNTQDARSGTAGGMFPQAAATTLTDTFSNTINVVRGLDDAGSQGSFSYRNMGYGFNGTDWDRIRVGVPGENVIGITNLGLLRTQIFTGGNGGTALPVSNPSSTGGDTLGGTTLLANAPYLFGSGGGAGSNWARTRGSYLATNIPASTLTARNLIGVALVDHPGNFSVVSNPAVDVQASASIASEASVRHKTLCVSFSAVSGAAVTAANATINVRDGATGAGTIMWTWQVAFPTAAAAGVQLVQPHSICGLNLTGTTATAMTAEFSAGVTGVIQSISIAGANVN